MKYIIEGNDSKLYKTAEFVESNGNCGFDENGVCIEENAGFTDNPAEAYLFDSIEEAKKYWHCECDTIHPFSEVAEYWKKEFIEWDLTVKSMIKTNTTLRLHYAESKRNLAKEILIEMFGGNNE